MNGIFVQCCAAVLAAQSSSGQIPANRDSLTLADVIERSQAHSAEIRAAKEELRAAKARIGQQNSRRRPQLALAGTAIRFDDASSIDIASQKIETLPNHQETLTLQINQLLDFANQVGTAVSQARLLSLSSEYALSSTSADVALDATSSYYNLLRAEQTVRVAESALAAYREQLKTTTRLFEAGVGQKIDVLRAESQVADAERDLVRRQNDRNVARSRINDLVGLPLDEGTQIEGASLLTSPGATDGVPTVEAAGLDRQTLIREALDRRTEALVAEIEVRAAEKGIKIARSSTDPQFTVGLSGNYYPTTSFQYVRQSTAAIALGVTIPIYDGGLAKDRVNEARAIVDRAKARKDRVRRDIALQVQNAAYEVESARKRLDAANVAVTSAKAARELAQQRYEAQVGIYIEVTDAQAALTAALAAQVDANADLLTARARLTRALGKPLVK